MCGDLEEDTGPDTGLQARFRAHAQMLIEKSAGKAKGQGLNARLDSLFHDALVRATRDQDTIAEGERYEVMAMQPLVLARLAGFLAAHASLREDPLRRLIEAVMFGYAEAETIAAEHDHGHSHDDHDEAHGHAHPHVHPHPH